ncbi:hypothetical protein tinsulaeT_16950 [Thalassotalea insulae]|uniref:DUF4878 domain-containing protein n=1 Tax=Thalassotalea insulae TaxID=2056778 RepID=A0ABQ6GV29_9GAMM|nr:hypothetical protein [Thalassotalea insulae]GLX78355.1 hypothetical protein tinsulaeT_16950 [Thalassotalea insulae]
MKSIIIAIFFALTLCACNEPKEISADQVAVAFFDALYNQKDIKQATSYCTPDFAKQLTQYRTAQNAARRLFNMSFDSTKIDAALADFKVREEFNTTGKLTILFTGDRHGKTYKELKSIKMVKKGQTWLVDELLKDPIAS